MRTKRKTRHAGFTFMELCLGILITAMVMGAVASFTLATAQAWKSAEQETNLAAKGNASVAWIQETIRSAKLLGPVRAGALDSPAAGSGAAVMLWTADTNSDGLIQGSEVQLIEHDVANNRLVLYSGLPTETTTWSYSSVFTNPSVIDTFKQGRTPRVFANDVSGACFSATGTTGSNANPSLAFSLKLEHAAGGYTNGQSNGERVLVQYGSGTVRAPKQQPGN
ncbi:MAG TPA: hypothetical protein VH518_10625 [Tepidisphaeraceae bacterium]|jgi:Tfp pilus assembly protein PilW